MTPADKITIAFAMALLAILYMVFWKPATPASYARLINHEHNVSSRALNKDQRFDIAGKLGNSTLQVENGKIRFVASPCTSKVCIHSGWLQHSGEVLACLPNGILVEMIGGEKQFDAINF